MPRSAARATKSVSRRADSAITGPDANSTVSRDQRQRVLVVVVHDHDREVGVLAGDQLDRLGDGDGERRDLVAELRRGRRASVSRASSSSSASRTRRFALRRCPHRELHAVAR